MKIVILGAFQDELTKIYSRFSDLNEIRISKARYPHHHTSARLVREENKNASYARKINKLWPR